MKKYVVDYVDGGLHEDDERGYLIYFDDHLNILKELQSRIEALEKDAARLDWLDTQVKRHVVYNGYAWQEAGYESNRGLVCAIQGKKQKKTVRQAIDAAMKSEKGGL